MLFVGQDKNVMSSRSLSQAIALYKTAANLARKVGIDPELIYKWRNQNIKIPLAMALRIADATKIDFERLSPHTPEANFLIKNRGNRKNLIKMDINNILMNASASLRNIPSDRPVIVGEDRVLISGKYQLEAEQIKGREKVSVIVVDLEALFSGMQALHAFAYFLISEHIEIGLRFEQLIGNHQGLRHDLAPNRYLKTSKNSFQVLPIWGEVKGRKDLLIAKVLGYSTNTYYRAKHVYLYGIPVLIQAMDLKKIRINKAFQIAKLSEADQENWIKTHLTGDVPR